MSTNSTIQFKDSVQLYSHYDGYPQGMANKLAKAIEKYHSTENRTNIVNCFIAENFDNCEIVLDKQFGYNYQYDVDFSNNEIKMSYHLYNDGVDKTFVFGIDEFLNRYHQDKWILDERHGPVNFNILNSHLYFVGSHISKALTWKNFLDNPNYINWKQEQNRLREVLCRLEDSLK
jgi:hypothetical protein